MNRHLGILFAMLERFPNSGLDDAGTAGQSVHEADSRFSGIFDQLRFQFIEARGELGLYGFLYGRQLLIGTFSLGGFQFGTQGGELRFIFGNNLIPAALVAYGFPLGELLLVCGADGLLG